jgi:protoheme IX farnesyltransferase
MAVTPLADALPAPAGATLADALPTAPSATLGHDLAGASWRDYVTLTKPRIMSLLVLTAVCAMIAAAGGTPDLLALGGLIIGGSLACGGASALNHVLDRDIDRLMGPRTATRPVAAGRISPLRATLFGLGLSALAFAILVASANLLAAALSATGGLFYVLVYTVWLKRTTSQNIVIGGTAGAIPALAGWAAAHGTLTAGGIYLFVIVLLWTPPHFWALALLLERHYAKAGVPMLPVVRGAAATARHVLGYSVLLGAFTLVPGLTGTFGIVYLVCAAALAVALCGLAGRLWRSPQRARAGLLFHFSLLYLALLFVAVAVDAAVR